MDLFDTQKMLKPNVPTWMPTTVASRSCRYSFFFTKMILDLWFIFHAGSRNSWSYLEERLREALGEVFATRNGITRPGFQLSHSQLPWVLWNRGKCTKLWMLFVPQAELHKMQGRDPKDQEVFLSLNTLFTFR